MAQIGSESLEGAGLRRCLTVQCGLCNLRITVNEQGTPSRSPSSPDHSAPTVHAAPAERDALTKDFDRLQSELRRLESRYMRLESQVHDLAIGYAMNNQAALQLTIDALKRLESLETRLGTASRKPQRSQKRPQRDASARRKAA